jgi:hypothetical protein
MRVLLLHPRDSLLSGPWSRQTWDLVVDLGNSSKSSETEWSRLYGCPVARSAFSEQGLDEARKVRDTLAVPRGRLVDEEGIDWWDLISLIMAPDLFMLLAFKSVAPLIRPGMELWVTRRGEATKIFESLLGRRVQSFGDGGMVRLAARTAHFAGLARQFTPSQIKQILLDKYDPGYRWRSRFAAKPSRLIDPVVLLPSAYSNVSRIAGSYATLLPSEFFLMIATRPSARQFVAPANIEMRDLASYGKGHSSERETASLTGLWLRLQPEIMDIPELRTLAQAGIFDSFPARIRDGIDARDAWREVLAREPVQSVLCGDDSNLYTRLPVLLAANRKIPTLDFHHGALDGRYLLKDLASDLYLSKSEMERDYLVRVCGLPATRVVLGAPAGERNWPGVAGTKRSEGDACIFFSEPYEVAEMRAVEVYREILPLLCRTAKENGRSVIVKLHPFESLAQRRRIVRRVLVADDQKLVTVVEGPLTAELMARAWFGITVHSTTVLDCLQNSVCCFLCGWLSLSPYEYVKQYARFGIGEVLHDVAEVKDIPVRLQKFRNTTVTRPYLFPTVDPGKLLQWLRPSKPVDVRSAP